MGLFDKNEEPTPNPQPEETPKATGKERRVHPRMKKNFVLTYFYKNNPQKRMETSQLKNISMGGICFVTSDEIKSNAELGVELRTPYLTDHTYVQGVVLESQQEMKDHLYLTRLEFKDLDEESKFLLSKLIEIFENEKGVTYD